MTGNDKAVEPALRSGLWPRKLALSWPARNRERSGRRVTADTERVAFIRTLESMAAFITAMEADFHANKLDHLGQVNRINSSFANLLSSAGNAGDVGLMISHRTRGLEDCLFDLSNAVQEKAERRIAFSNQANDEFESLCRQSGTFVKTSIDFLQTDNPVLLTWLDNKQKDCDKICDECASSHEERLIEGICTPSASMIYLDMLHSFKGIHSHMVHIVRLFAGLCGINEAGYS